MRVLTSVQVLSMKHVLIQYQLRNGDNPFSWGSSSTEYYTVEQAFLDAVDFPQLKRRLLTTVIENFDTSSYLTNMANNFLGEIRGASSKTEMRNKLASYISELFEEISNQIVQEMKAFKKENDNY